MNKIFNLILFLMAFIKSNQQIIDEQQYVYNKRTSSKIDKEINEKENFPILQLILIIFGCILLIVMIIFFVIKMYKLKKNRQKMNKYIQQEEDNQQPQKALKQTQPTKEKQTQQLLPKKQKITIQKGEKKLVSKLLLKQKADEILNFSQYSQQVSQQQSNKMTPLYYGSPKYILEKMTKNPTTSQIIQENSKEYIADSPVYNIKNYQQYQNQNTQLQKDRYNKYDNIDIIIKESVEQQTEQITDSPSNKNKKNNNNRNSDKQGIDVSGFACGVTCEDLRITIHDGQGSKDKLHTFNNSNHSTKSQISDDEDVCSLQQQREQQEQDQILSPSFSHRLRQIDVNY